MSTNSDCIYSITSSAPGKFILSGEHAVVYGSEAIAIAINKKSTSNLHLFEYNKDTAKPNDKFIDLDSKCEEFHIIDSIQKSNYLIDFDLDKLFLNLKTVVITPNIACTIYS